MARSALQLMID